MKRGEKVEIEGDFAQSVLFCTGGFTHYSYFCGVLHWRLQSDRLGNEKSRLGVDLSDTGRVRYSGVGVDFGDK